MQVKDCIAVVAGGASGLGEATVRRLSAGRAKVAILDLDESRGTAIAEELGNRAVFFRTDVTDTDSIQAAMDGTVECFGGLHLSINCAGVASPMKVLGKNGPVSIEKFNRVIQINLIGTMNVMRLAAEKMIDNNPLDDNEKGVIINTASIAAFDGQIGQAAYAASKAGVVGMTLPVAREFADHGIRVMTIAPGIFGTPMLGELPDKTMQALAQMMPFPKRLGKPDEYDRLVEHIVENTMFNGETIRLDAALRLAAK